MPRIGISRAEMNRRALDCAQLGQYDGAIAWALVALSDFAEEVTPLILGPVGATKGKVTTAPTHPSDASGDEPLVVPVYAADA